MFPEFSVSLQGPVNVISFDVVARISVVAILAAEHHQNRHRLVISRSIILFPDRELACWQVLLDDEEILFRHHVVNEGDILVLQQHPDWFSLSVQAEVRQCWKIGSWSHSIDLCLLLFRRNSFVDGTRVFALHLHLRDRSFTINFLGVLLDLLRSLLVCSLRIRLS